MPSSIKRIFVHIYVVPCCLQFFSIAPLNIQSILLFGMAKALFAAKEYSAAELAFLKEAENSNDAAYRAVQFSNAAQCALNLERYERAVDHATTALRLTH